MSIKKLRICENLHDHPAISKISTNGTLHFHQIRDRTSFLICSFFPVSESSNVIKDESLSRVKFLFLLQICDLRIAK